MLAITFILHSFRLCIYSEWQFQTPPSTTRTTLAIIERPVVCICRDLHAAVLPGKHTAVNFEVKNGARPVQAAVPSAKVSNRHNTNAHTKNLLCLVSPLKSWNLCRKHVMCLMNSGHSWPSSISSLSWLILPPLRALFVIVSLICVSSWALFEK